VLLARDGQNGGTAQATERLGSSTVDYLEESQVAGQYLRVYAIPDLYLLFLRLIRSVCHRAIWRIQRSRYPWGLSLCVSPSCTARYLANRISLGFGVSGIRSKKALDLLSFADDSLDLSASVQQAM